MQQPLYLGKRLSQATEASSDKCFLSCGKVLTAKDKVFQGCVNQVAELKEKGASARACRCRDYLEGYAAVADVCSVNSRAAPRPAPGGSVACKAFRQISRRIGRASSGGHLLN